jgi:hypothetical protein
MDDHDDNDRKLISAYAATGSAQANMMRYGVRLEGGGTLWIDDIAVEVLP